MIKIGMSLMKEVPCYEIPNIKHSKKQSEKNKPWQSPSVPCWSVNSRFSTAGRTPKAPLDSDRGNLVMGFEISKSSSSHSLPARRWF